MYFIGIDIGTSSTKTSLFDERCELIRSYTKSYKTDYPHPGWSEQNPDVWYEAACEGISAVIKGIETSLVKGIGASGQMHGLVILNSEDRVIRPAILWNDGRTEDETKFLNEAVGREKLSELTGNIAYAGFTAPKLLWLKKHEPENFGKIKKMMLPKDYINYRLTGVHSSDFSDASGTLLLDVKNRRWSQEMLDICGIADGQLPSLFESYECIGEVLPSEAKKLGLPEGVKVAAGAGDNAAAAIGTKTIGDGACNISLGTSGTVFIASDSFRADRNNGLHSFAHADGRYHLMACILSAASCNQWLMDKILLAEDYEKEQGMILPQELGNNRVFFLPYLMGERSPINDVNARGTFTGLSLETERKDLVLAVLEGVAFAIRDNVEIAGKLGIEIKESKVCGGGARSRLWLTILANVLNMRLRIPENEQGPSIGSAILAMVCCGVYADAAQACAQMEEAADFIEPVPSIAARYDEQYKKYSLLYPAMKPVFRAISQ